MSYDVEALIKRGLARSLSRTVLGQIGIGVAIHTGAAEARLQHASRNSAQMLLNAVPLATPGEGSSGRYVASLVERLGIAIR